MALTTMTTFGLHLVRDLCLEAVHLLDLHLDLGLGLEDLEDLGPGLDLGLEDLGVWRGPGARAWTRENEEQIYA